MSKKSGSPSAGVFGFLISETDHFYLGASLDMDETINRWVEELNQNKGKNHELQQDWKRYGGAEVDIPILEELPPDTASLELDKLLHSWLTRIPYAEKL